MTKAVIDPALPQMTVFVMLGWIAGLFRICMIHHIDGRRMCSS